MTIEAHGLQMPIGAIALALAATLPQQPRQL
jgi:hypothetical protein